ncbi:hypothetical protein FWC31_03520 [Candidatus Saccharibacteria bacterium]|nr:hypothetical protein [Candidatus Saccharibacteria bacterium]
MAFTTPPRRPEIGFIFHDNADYPFGRDPGETAVKILSKFSPQPTGELQIDIVRFGCYEFRDYWSRRIAEQLDQLEYYSRTAHYQLEGYPRHDTEIYGRSAEDFRTLSTRQDYDYQTIGIREFYMLAESTSNPILILCTNGVAAKLSPQWHVTKGELINNGALGQEDPGIKRMVYGLVIANRGTDYLTYAKSDDLIASQNRAKQKKERSRFAVSDRDFPIIESKAQYDDPSFGEQDRDIPF